MPEHSRRIVVTPGLRCDAILAAGVFEAPCNSHGEDTEKEPRQKAQGLRSTGCPSEQAELHQSFVQPTHRPCVAFEEAKRQNQTAHHAPGNLLQGPILREGDSDWWIRLVHRFDVARSLVCEGSPVRQKSVLLIPEGEITLQRLRASLVKNGFRHLGESIDGSRRERGDGAPSAKSNVRLQQRSRPQSAEVLLLYDGSTGSSRDPRTPHPRVSSCLTSDGHSARGGAPSVLAECIRRAICLSTSAIVSLCGIEMTLPVPSAGVRFSTSEASVSSLARTTLPAVC
eukprot:scaffold7346_cov245-Pinguiococcus_pyrenoidosus.AAC.9